MGEKADILQRRLTAACNVYPNSPERGRKYGAKTKFKFRWGESVPRKRLVLFAAIRRCRARY